MVCAGLTIKLGVDGVALTKLDLVGSLEGVELPPNEGVIERVHFGSDEGAAPVHKEAEVLQVLLALRREELKPVLGVDELGDFVSADSDLGQYLKLSRASARCPSSLSRLDLAAETASRCMDRHASAVEGEREENFFAELALVADLELALGHRVGMAYIILNRKVRVPRWR